MEARTGTKDDPLYLICRSGSRGRQACEQFLAAGYHNVVNVEGGTLEWERVGLPVVQGTKTVSLERQVRIAAGSLVLLGTGLGAFVHLGFLALSAFVGAGLVFAGITDTCGMGMLLAVSSGDIILNFSQLGMVSLRQVSFGREVETRTLKPFAETLGYESRLAKLDQQPEASLAWWWGDHPAKRRQ